MPKERKASAILLIIKSGVLEESFFNSHLQNQVERKKEIGGGAGEREGESQGRMKTERRRGEKGEKRKEKKRNNVNLEK